MKVNKLKRVVIKEEFVALTGDMLSAIILNQFLYWAERTKDIDKYIEEEIERAKSNDENAYLNKTHGWIYKSLEELKEEIMATVSLRTLKRRLDELVEAGWIETRENPLYKWDKTKQYRANLNKISQDLSKLGYVLQGYKFDLSDGHSGLIEVDKMSDRRRQNVRPKETKCPTEGDKLSNRDGQNAGAISEITIKENKKIEEEDRHLLFQEVRVMYKKAFKKDLNPIQEEELLNSGFDKNLLIEAIKIAALNNARQFNYVLKVLKDWKERGIESVGDLSRDKGPPRTMGMEYYYRKGYQ